MAKGLPGLQTLPIVISWALKTTSAWTHLVAGKILTWAVDPPAGVLGKTESEPVK